MSPASSASSLRPILTRTSLVRGNVTRRSPIAVSPRMVPMVILGGSAIGGSRGVGDRVICTGEAGGLFESTFVGMLLVFAGLPAFVVLASLLVGVLEAARFFADRTTLLYLVKLG